MKRSIQLTTTLVAAFFCLVQAVGAQEALRIATYNIKFLDTEISETRKRNLKEVIRELDADAIGLQEIDDRDALEQVFSPEDWSIVIDDDSTGENQDVALVVSNDSGLEIQGFDSDLDACDGNFLFPDSDENSAFPGRRDVLFAELRPEGATESFYVMVQHTKARYGGRFSTTPRRQENSRKLLLALEERFEDENYVIVGDFNDSPDDSALNILEEGDPNAPTVMEDRPGVFLVNLVEPLWAQGQCSWGHNTRSIVSSGDAIDLVDLEARAANFSERHSDSNEYHRRNLLDHILVPQGMLDRYVTGSAAIFDGPAGVRNGSRDRASDHLPVYADFRFVSESSVKIVAALPDPDGPDAGNETVTLESRSSDPIVLNGWTLEDRAGHRFGLSGSIAAGDRMVVPLPSGKLPLNQSGDTIALYDDSGGLRDRATYKRSDVRRGSEVVFE